MAYKGYLYPSHQARTATSSSCKSVRGACRVPDDENPSLGCRDTQTIAEGLEDYETLVVTWPGEKHKGIIQIKAETESIPGMNSATVLVVRGAMSGPSGYGSDSPIPGRSITNKRQPGRHEPLQTVGWVKKRHLISGAIIS